MEGIETTAWFAGSIRVEGRDGEPVTYRVMPTGEAELEGDESTKNELVERGFFQREGDRLIVADPLVHAMRSDLAEGFIGERLLHPEAQTA